VAQLPADEPVTVLVGPEGDFSIDEVEWALAHGYESVSAGQQQVAYRDGRTDGRDDGPDYQANKMKKIVLYLVVLLTAGLSSCTDNDYVQAIPGDSTLLMSINTAKVSGAGSPVILKTMLHVSNLDNTGLDLASKLYFFEDAPGNLGLCARLSDDSKLTATLERLGLEVTQKRGYRFAALKNTGWWATPTVRR
jgi:hypothetical protein